nr:LptA/OstA family protein [Sphingomonas jejuensis]
MLPGLLLLGPATPAPAQALANHNSNAPVDVDADRFEVQDRQDRAVFSGNVRVRQGGLNLDAQRLTIAYQGGPSSGVTIQRLDASGGVTVRSATETARGNFAVYDLNRRQITMVGGVTLQQGPNRLNGGRLVIDLTTGRSVIDGSAVGGTSGSTAPGSIGSSGGRVTGRFQVPQRGGN